jgi:hypothetical protein
MLEVCSYCQQSSPGLGWMLVEYVVVVWELCQLLRLQLIVLWHWRVHGLVHFKGW